MSKRQDLATGKVSAKLLSFALPIFLANALQSLYNIVDMLVVGRMVGEVGLAAISNASMVCFLINAVCMGIAMGGSVLIAQYKGAGKGRAQAQATGMLLLLALAISAMITAIGLAFSPMLFRALKVPPEAYRDACDYMRVICWGTVFVFGYNALGSIWKGLGDSRTPLCFVGIAALINVGLDILLVGPLEMGTVGAAYATVAAQGLSFAAGAVFLRCRRHRKERVAIEFTLRLDKLAEILRIGVPAAMQMLVVNVAYLLVTGMLNQFGTSVAAASGVGLKINTFAGMHCWAIGQAVSAMVGQAIGARKIRRVRRIVKTGLWINLCATLMVVSFVQLFARDLIRIFGEDNPVVLRDGEMYLRICCGVNSLIYAAMYTFDSFAIGAGAANVALGDALLDAMVVRLPVGWILAFAIGIGFPGIYWGQALSPILPAIVGAWYFKSGTWKEKMCLREERREKMKDKDSARSKKFRMPTKLYGG